MMESVFRERRGREERGVELEEAILRVLIEERKRDNYVTLTKNDLKADSRLEDTLKQLLLLDEQVSQENISPIQLDIMLQEYA